MQSIGKYQVQNFTFKQFTKEIHASLKHWHTIRESTPHLLESLLLVHNHRKKLGVSNPASLRLATNRTLQDGLDILKRQDAKAVAIIEKRFINKQKIELLTHQFKVNKDKFKRMQRSAIESLATMIFELEQKAREEKISLVENNLETRSYTKLFGIEKTSEKFFNHLIDSQAHELLILAGLGGSGKTSLANYVVRKIIPHFLYEDVIWLSIGNLAQGQEIDSVKRYQSLIHRLSQKVVPHLSSNMRPDEKIIQLRQLLKQSPYLIIIDNLELQADMSYLLSNLLELSLPSKFLLTSRTQPAGHAGVMTYILSGLNQKNSLEFIRYYAKEIGLPELAEAEEKALMPIYNVVGGNPFAIKLVVGLLRNRALPEILKELESDHSTIGEELYTKIFWQAWHSLQDRSKKLLTIMPLSPESGLLPDQMIELADLSSENIWPAINELISRSLLEVKGNVWERKYGIHQLTVTFIKTHILK